LMCNKAPGEFMSLRLILQNANTTYAIKLLSS
jgi:hypothetical protein